MDVGTLLASRFRVLRTLGKGGMSTVYEALDTHLDRHVALKIIRRPEGFSLLRFKEEFRALTELRHRNLIELYDLARDGETWFFTMELIEGVDLVTYVDGVRTGEAAYLASVESNVLGAPSGERITPVREIFRLMAEIGAAVAHLHSQGTVHRDLKPSNILVDGRARPRILDFGIARFVTASEGVRRALQTRKVGTPGYVAPEQIQGRAIPASDIYSLGVILYRLLTGKLPFRGRKKDVLRQHLTEIPPPPIEIASGADPLLAELAMRMLAKDPGARPTAAELALITRPEREAAFADFRPVDTDDTISPLVGREQEIRRVLGHLAEVTLGDPLLVCVEGPSGIGKTRLAEEAMELTRLQGLRCFHARCYEREQIPYKAVDALVDQAVGTVLGEPSPQHRVRDIPPHRLRALARLFPFAAELPIGPAAPEDAEGGGRESTGKRAAFSGLVDLLRVVAGEAGLLLFIDDLQWADDGSFELLRHLLGQGDLRVGMVATLRSAEGEIPPWIADRRAGPQLHIEHVPLGPIDRHQTEALIQGILPRTRVPGKVVDQIAAEAQGSPLVIEELVRFYLEYAGTGGARGALPPLTFAEMLQRRMAELDETSRAVMEVCAAAGYALGAGAIAAAAKAPLQAISSAATDLIERRMLRQVAGKEGTIRLCPFHDRATAIVLDEMEPSQRRSHHRRLATFFGTTSPTAYEALADHWRLAGVPERASRYALRAAEHAEELELTQRAVRYYALALGCLPSDVEAWQIRMRLAEALDRCGRFTEAGRAFRHAARLGPARMRTALTLRAARALLKSGEIGTAIRTMERVTEQLWREPLILPRWDGVLGLVREYVGSRSWLPSWMAGRAGALDSIQLCIDLAQGLRYLLPQRAAELAYRSLRLSRRRADPVLRAQVLTAVAGVVALSGTPRSLRRARTMLGVAEDLYGADPGAIGQGDLYANRAFVGAVGGGWDEMRTATEHALETYEDERLERSWQAQMLRVNAALAEIAAGELARAEYLSGELLPGDMSWSDPHVPGWVRWARVRIDLAFARWEAAETHCREGLRAIAGAHSAAAPLWLRFRGGLAVALAGQGETVAGVTVLRRTTAVLGRLPWLDPLSRAEFDHHAAFVHCSAARRETGAARRRSLSFARRHARRLCRARPELHRPRGLRWMAEVALLRGRPRRAVREARRAVQRLRDTGQRLEASLALRVLAEAEDAAGSSAAQDTRRDAIEQTSQILRAVDRRDLQR